MEFTTNFELQSQATRLFENNPCATWFSANYGTLTLYGCPIPRDSNRDRQLDLLLQTTIPFFKQKRDFQGGLFPLHSPLLRESWLVSFPPLNYMLKFRGSSFLIWGLMFLKKMVNKFIRNMSLSNSPFILVHVFFFFFRGNKKKQQTGGCLFRLVSFFYNKKKKKQLKKPIHNSILSIK